MEDINPFKEVKDHPLIGWLWKFKKRHVIPTTLIGLLIILFTVFNPIGGVWDIIMPSIGGLWIILVAFLYPSLEYLDLIKTYNTFEVSVNKDALKQYPLTPKDCFKYKRIILAGPAGSGKDYLRDKFHELGYIVDVSYTTRPQRDGEKPGYTYQYVSKDHFKHLKNKGFFYETVDFNRASYGTLNSGWKNSDVFIMTPSGISQISEQDRENCIIVYFKIDEDIRRKRMLKRSDNGFDKIERRIEADNKDFKGFLPKADIVITDPLFDSNNAIKDILLMAKI